MPRPAGRQLLGALAAGLVGLLLLLAGLDREQFRCDRAAGSCSLTAGMPGLATTTEIPLEAIVDHRFDTYNSRAGQRGATVLIDATGRLLAVARADESTARDNYDGLHAFFLGQSAGVEVTTGPSWWLALFGLAVMVVGPWLVLTRAAPRTSPPVETPASRSARNPVIALVIGGLILAGMAASTLLARTRGSLALRCTHRCDVDGGTCMPGAELMLTLAPGEHEVRIFNPAAPESPIVKRVAVVRGQVTHFECAP